MLLLITVSNKNIYSVPNGDNIFDTLGPVCKIGGNGGNDKINAAQGDDELTGGGGADKFKCGSGDDTITYFSEAVGDKQQETVKFHRIDSKRHSLRLFLIGLV